MVRIVGGGTNWLEVVATLGPLIVALVVVAMTMRHTSKEADRAARREVARWRRDKEFEVYSDLYRTANTFQMTFIDRCIDLQLDDEQLAEIEAAPAGELPTWFVTRWNTFYDHRDKGQAIITLASASRLLGDDRVAEAAKAYVTGQQAAFQAIVYVSNEPLAQRARDWQPLIELYLASEHWASIHALRTAIRNALAEPIA